MNMPKRHRIIFAFLVLLFTASAQSYAAETIELLKKAEASGILLYWDSLSETGLMEKNGHQISFRDRCAGGKVGRPFRVAGFYRYGGIVF